MNIFDEKKKGIIINTGQHLGKANITHSLSFMMNRQRIVPPFVKKQSRRTGNIIYGCSGVNAIVGRGFTRPTHDFDIFSSIPKKHAIQLERHIDKSVGADLAYVEGVPYSDKNMKGTLYRVLTRPWGHPEADYNKKKKRIKFVVKKGVRYESLDAAEKKYNKMIREGEMKRMVNAHQDLGRIALYRLSQRRRRLL